MNLTEADEEAYALLHEGFPDREVEERTQGNRTFRYIKTGSIQNRLDEVLGPPNWGEAYEIIDAVTVLCRLTITLPSGLAVTKVGVGLRKDPAETKSGDAGRTWKAGYTDALKHAASKHGVGRYLRGSGIPRFVQPALDRLDAREREARTPAARPVVSLPPAAEAPPTPAESRANGHQPPAGARNRVNQPAYPDPPRTGRQLYAWARDRGQDHEFNLAGYLTNWAKLQGGFPGRLVDFNAEQVEMAHDEAVRKLALLPAHGDAHEDAPAN